MALRTNQVLCMSSMGPVFLLVVMILFYLFLASHCTESILKYALHFHIHF